MSIMASVTINIHGNREISFYVAQTVVEVANTESDTKKSIKSLDATASAAAAAKFLGLIVCTELEISHIWINAS